jgi:coenzyme F420-reducing hydrogenase gamma subunit
MSVSCECCVLSSRVFCVGLITRPEESYRLWCLECDREASIMRRPWPTGAAERLKKTGMHAHRK